MAVFWDMAPCSPVEIGQRWPPSSLPLKRRSVSTTVQGATSHKTAIFILAVVRTWNVNQSLKVFLEEYREMTATFVQPARGSLLSEFKTKILQGDHSYPIFGDSLRNRTCPGLILSTIKKEKDSERIFYWIRNVYWSNKIV